MIIAIYLTEFQTLLPLNTVTPITSVNHTTRERRDRNRGNHPAFFEHLVKAQVLRSDNYDSNGQFVEQEQLFNRLA